MPATIKDLPSELSAHIFDLVLNAEPCGKLGRDLSGSKPRHDYPIVLAHVCSHWRDIVLNTPTLWYHIDISTSATLNQLYCNHRAKFYLNHVGQTPVDLHIFDPTDHPVSRFRSKNPFYELIAQVASRASSLNLDAHHKYDPETHRPILSTFFKASVPGKLARLIMRHDHDYNSGFIRAEDDPDDDGLDLGLPMEQFESLLSSVTVLHLDRLYPRWTSCAYHGLVELRLNGFQSSINESDLVGILRSSLGLRILELGLDIEDPLPIEAQITPIVLGSLEALNVSEVNCSQLSSLLRWLAPGSKPLQFSIRRGTYEDLKPKESLQPFLSCAHVTRMYAKGLFFSHIIELLRLSPSLRELVVSWVSFDPSSLLRGEDIINTAMELRLEYFRIVRSPVHIEDILALTSVPGLIVKNITFHWCGLFRSGVRVPIHGEGSLLEEFYRNHPNVKVFIEGPEKPYPVKDWDLFASYHNF